MGTRIVCQNTRFPAFIGISDAYPITDALTDLYYPRTDAATSVINHAGGAAAEVVGVPVYSAQFATFPSTARLLTTRLDTTNDVTLVGVFRQPTNVTATAPGPAWVLGNFGSALAHTIGLYASADEIIGLTMNASAGHNIRTPRTRSGLFVFAALRQAGGTKSLLTGLGGVLSVAATADVVRTHGSANPFAVGPDPAQGAIDGVPDVALAAIHQTALSDTALADLYQIVRFAFARQGLEVE